MRDPIERFGKTLLQQQTVLCEEWRKANPDTVVLPVLPWHREASDFHGVGLLTGHAWLRLRDWWKRPKSPRCSSQPAITKAEIKAAHLPNGSSSGGTSS